MNLLRIIPKRESAAWIKLLFEKGPHTVPNAPAYPLTFPLSSRLQQNVAGAFLYVVYDGKVVGYAPIKEVRPHTSGVVGQERNPISSGDTLILDGPLLPLPYTLTCRGLRQFRYTAVDLHSAGHQVAQDAVSPPPNAGREN